MIGWPVGPASSALVLLVTAQTARGNGSARGGHRHEAEGPGAGAPHLGFTPFVLPARNAGDVVVRGARSARSAHHAGQPWPQAGFGLTIGTEPVAVVGSTWTNFAPVCHWKMKCAATTFWPMALNFAGPCTVCTVTPLCR